MFSSDCPLSDSGSGRLFRLEGAPAILAERLINTIAARELEVERGVLMSQISSDDTVAAVSCRSPIFECSLNFANCFGTWKRCFCPTVTQGNGSSL